MDAKRYRTIVADPPWHYDDFMSTGGTRKAPFRITKPMPYRSMTVDEMCALPIADLAANDCVLFLWVPSAYLPDAFRVVDAWEFNYRQTCVWHKTGSRPRLGGSVAPNHAEFLLVAKRGHPTVERWTSSVILAPGNSGGRTNAHSRKPEVILDLIEQIAPAPWIELFARRNRFGWDTWGNECLEHVDLAAVSPNPTKEA